MPITLNGDTGIVTPMYNGSITANAVTPSVNMKNRIINGAMVIDQRNAGASYTPTAFQYTVDRWKFYLTQASKLTCGQNQGSVTPPVGFTNYMGSTSSSAYSLAAGDYFVLSQLIEGYNISDLGWGTANAKTVTLSFWVRSSLTGTFGGALGNSAGDRGYPFTYTISAANTWEQKSVTIAGDTTGTWLTNNATGLALYMSLGSGSTYSGTAGSWASAFYTSTTGATSVVGTNGATFYITGVQLEVGSTATSFDYRPYGTEFQLCQRYYQRFNASSANTGFGSGQQSTTTTASFYITYPTMRTAPTFTFSNIGFTDNNSFQTAATLVASNIGDSTAQLNTTNSAVGAALRACILNANSNASAYMERSAEL